MSASHVDDAVGPHFSFHFPSVQVHTERRGESLQILPYSIKSVSVGNTGAINDKNEKAKIFFLSFVTLIFSSVGRSKRQKHTSLDSLSAPKNS